MPELEAPVFIDIEQVFVSGINYKNADVELRSAFALDDAKKEICINEAKKRGFSDFVILNTCNRTEVFGIGPVDEAEKIILEVCNQDVQYFNEVKIVKQAENALKHIFDVASGLDSQILGDYEILGQFKKACKHSKNNKLLSPLFERIANTCIQASKEIKTRTELSKGTVSTSYAAIEVIKEKFKDTVPDILIIGTGKIGHNIAKNVRHYLKEAHLTLSNRTLKKASHLAEIVNADIIEFEKLDEYVHNFEVVIICSEFSGFNSNSAFSSESKTQLILDLAVPCAVRKEFLPETIKLMNVDDISAILNNSIEQRKLYLPVAHEIINQHLINFGEWYKLYKHKDRIAQLKNLLKSAANHCPHLDHLEPELKEKKVNLAMQKFIEKIKKDPEANIDFNMIIENFKTASH